MAGRVTQHRVHLNRKPRRRLETLVRRRSPQHWLVQRARVVLLSAEGLEVHQIGARLSIDRQVVRRWVKRYIAQGYDGLRDRRRSGRPPEIEHHVWQKLATVAKAGDKDAIAKQVAVLNKEGCGGCHTNYRGEKAK